MSTEKYSAPMRGLHWLMALVIIGLLASGIYMEELEDSDFKFQIYHLHKSFGSIALLLIAVRLAIRLKTAVPSLPQALTRWEQKAAHAAHHSLYLLMVLMPVSGYVMSAAHPERYGAWLFGLRLPDLPPSEFWAGLTHEAHAIAGNLMIMVLVLHIVGVIKHRLFDKNEADVLPRMLG